MWVCVQLYVCMCICVYIYTYKNLVYTPKTTTSNILDKKQRKRHITWFNPPYSVNVKTNIVNIFLSLRKRYFPKKNMLDEEKIYFGLAATIFKERFGKYEKDINHKQPSKNTELSKYIWSLKDAKISYSFKWSIVERVYGKTKIVRCPLCLTGKLQLIEYYDDIRLLNEISELLITVDDSKM